MTGFHVDLQALETAAAGIVGVLQELDRHDVNDIDCAHDAFGHDNLADTTKDFCNRWQKGVTNLAHDGSEMAVRLVECVNAYRDNDDKAAKSFGSADAMLANAD